MPKITDSFVLGILGGFIATIVMDLGNLIRRRNQKTEMTFCQLSGSVLMPVKRSRQQALILGQVMHIITGSLIAIPMVYIIKATGKDHPVIKGAAFGSFIWMALYVLGERIGIYSHRTRLLKTHYSTLIDNILYGIVLTKTILCLGHPSLFKSKRDPAAVSSGPRLEPYAHVEDLGLPAYKNHAPDLYH